MDEEHEGRRREEIALYLVNYKVKILLLLIIRWPKKGPGGGITPEYQNVRGKTHREEGEGGWCLPTTLTLTIEP